jgi:hypothetical protein
MKNKIRNKSSFKRIVYILLVFMVLIHSSLLTASEEEIPPIKALSPWDRWNDFNDSAFWMSWAVIFGDSSGKPAFDRLIMDKEAKAYPCEHPWGKWYEYRCVPMGGDSGVESLYVFDEQAIEGKKYAKVKFCNDWAWIALPDEYVLEDLGEEERQCYLRTQSEKVLANRAAPQVVKVKMEEPVTLSDEFSVIDGEWIKFVELEKAGRLRVSLPKGQKLEESDYISFRIESALSPDDSLSWGFTWGSSEVANSDAYAIPLSAGRYKIIVGESNEHWYLPPCPPNRQAVTVVLTPLPAHIEFDEAGSTPDTAYDLGALTAPILFRGFVGGIDPVDLYRFTLTAAIGVRIDLTDLSADADLALYRDFDGDGLLAYHDRIASSGVSGFRDESITMLGLHPGAYFLRVGKYEGDTEYNLSITPKPLSGADLELRRTDRNSADLGSE